jgi:hypothetical protein
MGTEEGGRCEGMLDDSKGISSGMSCTMCGIPAGMLDVPANLVKCADRKVATLEEHNVEQDRQRKGRSSKKMAKGLD